MKIKNEERGIGDRLSISIGGVFCLLIGVFLSGWGLLWIDYLGIFPLLLGVLMIWRGNGLINSKYEDIVCKCGKVIPTHNELTIIFCPHCKEKIKLVREVQR